MAMILQLTLCTSVLVRIMKAPLALSSIGQIVSGLFLFGWGFPTLSATMLSLAIFLPIMVLAQTFRGPTKNSLWSFVIMIIIYAINGGRNFWSPHLLTWPGVLLALLIVSANVGLLWRSLHRHFATCALTYERNPFAKSA